MGVLFPWKVPLQLSPILFNSPSELSKTIGFCVQPLFSEAWKDVLAQGMVGIRGPLGG